MEEKEPEKLGGLFTWLNNSNNKKRANSRC